LRLFYQIFEDFFWREFCDNYLEIVKKRLSIESAADKKKISAQYACYHSFLNILKMVSPFVPHITEEMFHADVITKQTGDVSTESITSNSDSGYFSTNEGMKSIHNTLWPSDRIEYSSEGIGENADLALLVIAEIRKYKADNKIKLSTPVSVLKIKCSEEQKARLSGFLDDLASLARAEKIEVKAIDSQEIGIEITL
jgi:valyl-tRNA synthetase